MFDINEKATVFAPASLSNLGPGFDTLGLCLSHLGDRIEAKPVASPGVFLEEGDVPSEDIPADPLKNTASVAAAAVLKQAGSTQGLSLKITKGFTPGSGIGSSAASAVGGAWAANMVLGSPFSKEELIEAVLAGEAIASGCRHGDNVLPALFGGLVLVSSSDPTSYRKIDTPYALWIAVFMPEVEVLTVEARALLPAQVPLQSAVNNASALAFMLDAFRAGDWEEVGKYMMSDGIIEPVRAKLVPCYPQVKQAALEAGAPGCALTGSGPAMFAISDSKTGAQHVLEAMLDASRCEKIGCTGHVCAINTTGVTALEEVVSGLEESHSGESF